MQLSFEKTEDVSNFINNTESGMYQGKTDEGEKAVVMLEQGVGMDVHVYQKNGWIRVDDYNQLGIKEGETFNGRWNKGEDN